MRKTLRLILGDQLNERHTCFSKVERNVTYVMMEMRQETDYVSHHIQKVVAFFSAMRSFSIAMQKKGHEFIYLKINDANNEQSLTTNIKKLIKDYDFEHFEYQLPDDYRLDKQLKELCTEISISNSVLDTEHFLSKRNDVAEFFKGKKQFLLENFYR